MRIVNVVVFLLIFFGFVFITLSANEYMSVRKAELDSKRYVEEFKLQKDVAEEVNDVGRDDVFVYDTNYDVANDKDGFSAEYGDNIGVLSIPKIDSELPIVEGTDAEALEKGVGHFEKSSLPLDNDQIVLSGHRDTVFRRLGELERGDTITVHLEYGEFTYEVVDYEIVDADDRTIIVPHDEEILTVTTCYPFYYVGNAPERYIVNAKPIRD